MSLDLPGSDLPLERKKKPVPEISMKVAAHVIKPGMLTTDDEDFFRKSKIVIGKDHTRVHLGGNEERVFFVADIYHMRMTLHKGAPALVFVQVTSVPGEFPKTWLLSFPPGQPFVITKAEELRAVAKAIVSGYLGDFPHGFLEESYNNFDDLDSTTGFPVFDPAHIKDWPAIVAKLKKEKTQLEEENKDLKAGQYQFKEKEEMPPQTQPDPNGPNKPPPPELPSVAIGAPAPAPDPRNPFLVFLNKYIWAVWIIIFIGLAAFVWRFFLHSNH